ncbi:MAG: hypothetical protein ACRD40_05870 [Candidatus Acidiferrales bacterium]
MQFNWKRITAVGAVLVLFWTGLAFASPRMTPGERSMYATERASRLLTEIQNQAADLTKHAGTLESMARQPQYSWESHAFYLERVKDHINAVGVNTAELQRISADAQPWQQRAISQVTSHAAQVAASAQAAIVYLNDNHSRLFVPEYRGHVTTIADSSQNMKQTVDQFLDYEKAEQKFQHLHNTLELGE